MALAPRLDLRQSQSLVMTPQLQQAIKLLTLSNLEVETFIAEELERNPLLEADGADGEADPASDRADTRSDADADEPFLDGAGGDAPLDVPREDAGDGGDGGGAADGSLGLSAAGAPGGGEAPDIDTLADGDPTLHEHLQRQAGETLSGRALLIAGHLIEQIDEAGYLTEDLIAFSHRLGIDLAEAEDALAAIQTFDPGGVGARSLAECLEIQAREADRFDPCMEKLIGNLDLLAKGAFDRLERMCGVDREDLMDMVAELRSYDPKPGSRFGSGRAQEIVPDIFVARREGGWVVEVNQASLPRLLVNRRYHAELSDGAQDKASRAWLNQCLTDANWLLKALDQRQRTIVKVASAIVKHQEMFFRKGVAHMRPLTLRTVAEAIDMHESTVSRVTSNKFLSCERGTFELKYFFTSGIQATDGGEAVSAEAVKSRIRALIDAEDPKKILSDDKLVSLLKSEGFDIARRTVAKYREAMNIGSSVQRRRQKALGEA